ncbi:putative F-box associated interaction domain-containing protein [Medicago truncatula]|uniref:F-box protein interaction domain protein n=1 Tax=Medicago truncatula TaxID=3880 RepID=G7K8T6_MEDTR|nr:F-box protein CPR1 [Medicago truncatula]AES60603.1 F-box protein interaction domain protein [Medicago truncatula]AES97705.1 F-box protein interaction domain protein [Medicago truncatula]RHN79158.1 putative F-box associated interaction domain-containing protein [Medicago truncatula]
MSVKITPCLEPSNQNITEYFGYFCDPINVTFNFAFGCDNSTGTYKVVAYRSRYIYDQLAAEVRVINMGDDVWRNIESFPVIPFCYDSVYYGAYKYVYLSGALNWLAIHNFICYDCNDITVDQFVIVSLDLETETYNQYIMPHGFDEVPPKEPTIGVLRGCLCFSYSYKETDFVIWEMKEFGVEDSWTQLLKVSYHNLLIDYDFSDPRIKFVFQLMPLFLSEDGDTLILESNQESQTIILYNRRDNRAERARITASKATTDNTTSDHVDLYYANDYVESLVPSF